MLFRSIAALVLLALAVIGHVAGNALGTRLRQNGSRPVDEEGLDLPSAKPWPRALSPDEFAPATQLSRRSSLGRPIFVATVLGTIAGGIGGGLWPAFAARNGPEKNLYAETNRLHDITCACRNQSFPPSARDSAQPLPTMK